MKSVTCRKSTAKTVDTRGIMGEVNEWAATEDGEWGHILDRLVAEAKIAGLEVI